MDIAIASEAMCLCVLLDSTLTFAPHVHHLAGRCYYHLRQSQGVSIIDRSDNATKTMVHSFVINRIDYCNSVLYGMSAVHMRPLQNVLNSAARVVLKMSKFQHNIAAVCDQLHWLLVKQRGEFKQALFVYKVLRQTGPPYLVD